MYLIILIDGFLGGRSIQSLPSAVFKMERPLVGRHRTATAGPLIVDGVS